MSDAPTAAVLRITSPEGWCTCPCHGSDQVLHAGACCRPCPQCGNGLPLGIDEHACRKAASVSGASAEALKKSSP
jgi:hypothetical protein